MDVYQIITNRIMELLEQGTIPWRKAWAAGSSMPRNMISNKEYCVFRSMATTIPL